MDDKPISGIDISTNNIKSKTFFITLNGHDKRKCLEIESINSINDIESSKDTILLATSFRKLIAVLTTALKDSRSFVVSTTLSTSTSTISENNHIDEVKTELKNEMKEIQSMMKRILQAVASQQAVVETTFTINQR